MGNTRQVRNVRVNDRYFRNERHHQVKRRSFAKTIKLASIVTAVGIGMGLASRNTSSRDTSFDTVVEEQVITTTPEELTDLNLVFDKSGFQSSIYQTALENLKEMGVGFREYEDGLLITPDDTVISLTSNRYVEGDIALYGPLVHENNNDNLLMSFQAACIHGSWNQEPFHFGREYRGNIEETSLESKVGGNGTLLTLQFSDRETDADRITSLLLDGLTRYQEQKEIAPNSRYFHTMRAAEMLGNVAEKYQVPIQTIKELNDLDSINMVPIGLTLKLQPANTDPLNPNWATNIKIDPVKKM